MNTKTQSLQTKKIPVPDFATYEEEANFWDTHDITEVESTPVTVKVTHPLSHMLSVRFEGDTLKKLDEVADNKGLGTASLIRMWTMERLQTL